MKKLVLIAVFLLGFSMMAVAQDTPAVEIFGGYSFVRVDTASAFAVPENSFDLNMNGWNAQVAFNGNNWLGFMADFAGLYGTVNQDGDEASARVYSIMFGPRIAVRKGTFTPYFHALFGYARVSADEDEENVFTENDFAMSFGGGLDINVNDAIAIRPFQVDYFTVKAGQTGDFSDNLRYSAGIVFKMGKR